MFRACHKSSIHHCSGFTLLELLMVIIILGIAAAVLVPQLSGSAQQTRLVTGARSIVQASRYARTMALLHQSELELVLSPGKVEINAKSVNNPTQSDPLGDISPFDPSSGGTSATLSVTDGSNDPANETSGVNTNVAADVATAMSFADEVHQEFLSPGVFFRFLGYTDAVDNDDALTSKLAAAPAQEGTFSVSFKSNGTCRPFKIQALMTDEDGIPDEENSYTVAVDVIGHAKIEGYGNED